ncbi:MAG: RNA polymerase sporulation sigma factor SigK [Clostridia bacterium]|nr:RNA polymerase sporulation sigma factor SigK [Clostridia bacterium]MBQ9856619.1 RNA polymerase sporulation sigma factor SigK [Clostridia bacterium]
MRVFSDLLIYILDGAQILFGHLGVRSSFPKPLSEKEEEEKIRLACEGDEEAKRLLIEHNLRLVAHIAKKYAGGGADTDDLVSVGTIGLMKAVSTFRPEVGRLTTYASRCIENEILMLLRASKKLKSNISFNEPIGADKDGNSILVSDLLGTDPNALSDEAEIRIESRRALALIPKLLTPREQKVVCLRYGLIGGAPKPQHAVAKLLGISRSYVSRIEKKALEKLRGALMGE